MTISVSAVTGTELEGSIFLTPEDYCKYYGIEYVDTKEFRKEVTNMMEERKAEMSVEKAECKALMASGGESSNKKYREIPTAYIADVIWTDNPSTPWNHVGLYTKSNRITEALQHGVASRNTGWQYEYPFEVLKVTKKDSTNRFAKATREDVSAWAVKQIGKPYDFNFSDNKVNSVSANGAFNCSELVWKAWKYSAKVDLDANGGKGVYPNNIRDSKRTVKVKEG